MYVTGHDIERNPADGIPQATHGLCELLQHGDEGAKPDDERAAIWAQHSAEQGQFLAMIEWADILESGVGAGTAKDLAKVRDAWCGCCGRSSE
jgi:TPR repeat protein